MMTQEYRPLSLRVVFTSDSQPAAHGIDEQDSDDVGQIIGARFVVNVGGQTITEVAVVHPLVDSIDTSLSWLSPPITTGSTSSMDELSQLSDSLLRTWMNVLSTSLNGASDRFDPLEPIRDHLCNISEFILTPAREPSPGKEWTLWTSYFVNVKDASLVRKVQQAMDSSSSSSGAIGVCSHRQSFALTPRNDILNLSLWDDYRVEDITALVVDIRLSLSFTLYHSKLQVPIHFNIEHLKHCSFLRRCVDFFSDTCSRPELRQGDPRWVSGQLHDDTFTMKQPVGFILQHQLLYHMFYVPGAAGNLAICMLEALKRACGSSSDSSIVVPLLQQIANPTALPVLSPLYMFSGVPTLPPLPVIPEEQWAQLLPSRHHITSLASSPPVVSSWNNGLHVPVATRRGFFHCLEDEEEPSSSSSSSSPLSIVPSSKPTKDSIQQEQQQQQQQNPRRGPAAHYRQRLAFLARQSANHSVHIVLNDQARTTTWRYVRHLSSNMVFKAVPSGFINQQPNTLDSPSSNSSLRARSKSVPSPIPFSSGGFVSKAHTAHAGTLAGILTATPQPRRLLNKQQTWAASPFAADEDQEISNHGREVKQQQPLFLGDEPATSSILHELEDTLTAFSDADAVVSKMGRSDDGQQQQLLQHERQQQKLEEKEEEEEEESDGDVVLDYGVSSPAATC